MANVAVVQQFKNLTSYLPDGEMINAAIDLAVRSLTPGEMAADDLAFYSFEGISTTKQEISDNAGARPLLCVAMSKGTLCYIHFHDLDADNVTAGVDVDWLVPVAGTTNQVTIALMMGASWKLFWDVGLTVSASTTTETSSAPANTPNIWVLYRNSL